MSTLTVDESQLEQIVSKVVQQHLKMTFQDVDEVRKSPAETIVRLETKIESLADAVEELRVEIADTRVESKKDIEKLKAESPATRAESKEGSGKLVVETANSRTELKTEFEKYHAETKAEFEKIHARLTRLEDAQNGFAARLTKVERLVKLIAALHFILFGIAASWFAKAVFFP